MTELDQQTSPGDKRSDDFPVQNACCSGHCDSGALPAPLEPVKKTLATADIQTPIRILQMDCPTEEALLRNKLGDMPGVAAMDFNLMQRVLRRSIRFWMRYVRWVSHQKSSAAHQRSTKRPLSRTNRGGRWRWPGWRPSRLKACIGRVFPRG